MRPKFRRYIEDSFATLMNPLPVTIIAHTIPESILNSITRTTMKSPLDLLLLILSFALAATAQFQFFEQMFSHGQQQQQQPQNTGSDSAWYRQTYDNGGPTLFPASALRMTDANTIY